MTMEEDDHGQDPSDGFDKKIFWYKNAAGLLGSLQQLYNGAYASVHIKSRMVKINEDFNNPRKIWRDWGQWSIIYKSHRN